MTLIVCRDLTSKDKTVAEAALVKVAAEIEELKKEVDIRVAAFLKEEALGQDKASLLGLLRQEVSESACAGLVLWMVVGSSCITT